MAIKLQAFDDIKRMADNFFKESIQNVKNTEVPKELKGFKRSEAKARYDGRVEGLEAAQKAITQIITKIQEDGGFR